MHSVKPDDFVKGAATRAEHDDRRLDAALAQRLADFETVSMWQRDRQEQEVLPLMASCIPDSPSAAISTTQPRLVIRSRSVCAVLGLFSRSRIRRFITYL